MNILVACEFSGIVREAFRKRGHYAVSCDLLDSEIAGSHYTGNVLEILYDFYHQNYSRSHWQASYKDIEWDMMIAFPPCTHLAVSGARWFRDKQKEQKEAIEFFKQLVNAPIPKIAIENPVGIMSTHYRKPDQIIQP